jgi:hypothetical protein
MDKNNILDAYLEKKVEELNVPFEDAHWQHALRRLEEDDKRRGFAYWASIATALALLCIGGLAYLWTARDSNTPMVVQSSTAAQKNTSAYTQSRETLDVIETPTAQNEAPEVLTPAGSVVPANTESLIPEKDNSKSYDAKTSKGVSADDHDIFVPLKSKEAATVRHTLDGIDKLPVETNAAVIPSNREPVASTKSEISTSTTISKGKHHVTTKYLQASTKRNTEPSSNKQVLAAATQQSSVSDLERSRSSVVDANPSSDTKKSDLFTGTGINARISAEQGAAKESPSTSADLVIQMPSTVPSVMQKPVVNVAEQAAVVPTPLADKTTKASVVAKPWAWLLQPSIHLGGAYAEAPKVQDINTNTIIQKHDLALQGGLGFRYALNNKLGLNFGANLGRTGLLNFMSWTNRNGMPAQDTGSYVTRHENLLQLFVPLTASYNFLPKHTLVAGAVLSAPISLQYAVKDYGTMNYVKQWGATTGYQKQVYATLGYEFEILKQLKVYANYMYGFGDLTNDNLLVSLQHDRNSRASLGLQWHLKKNR